MGRKLKMIDILNRMYGLQRPIKCRYVGGIIEVRHLKMLYWWNNHRYEADSFAEGKKSTISMRDVLVK